MLRPTTWSLTGLTHPQERRVIQGRGVERLPRLFRCQPGRRELAEFVVNLRQQ